MSEFANRSGEAFDWLVESLSEDELASVNCLNWPVADGYNYKKGLFHSCVGTPNFGSNVEMYNALCYENYGLGEYRDLGAMMGCDGSGRSHLEQRCALPCFATNALHGKQGDFRTV